MNNYERNWFNKWFPTIERLKSFRKKFTRRSSSSEIGSCGKEKFRYNYPPNSSWTTRDTSFTEISKHKIDQCIQEREL